MRACLGGIRRMETRLSAILTHFYAPHTHLQILAEIRVQARGDFSLGDLSIRAHRSLSVHFAGCLRDGWFLFRTDCYMISTTNWDSYTVSFCPPRAPPPCSVSLGQRYCTVSIPFPHISMLADVPVQSDRASSPICLSDVPGIC